jgi:hypothetical protein
LPTTASGALPTEVPAGQIFIRGRASFLQPLRPEPNLTAMYLGPDSLMPVASAVAAIVGFVMMFWRRLVGAARLLAQRVSLRLRRR